MAEEVEEAAAGGRRGRGDVQGGRAVRRAAVALAGAAVVLLLVGLLLPQPVVIPVAGAQRSDWNSRSFWYEPWGASGVHKGIDIFAPAGTPVLAPSWGLVLYAGELGRGGRVLLLLGPRWRLHYLAHLDSQAVSRGRLLRPGDSVGTVGTTGNAAGRPPHLHYSVLTLVPYPWRMSGATQGWKQAFYLDPGDVLAGAGGD